MVSFGTPISISFYPYRYEGGAAQGALTLSHSILKSTQAISGLLRGPDDDDGLCDRAYVNTTCTKPREGMRSPRGIQLLYNSSPECSSAPLARASAPRENPKPEKGGARRVVIIFAQRQPPGLRPRRKLCRAFTALATASLLPGAESLAQRREGTAAQETLRWRLPVAFGTQLPALGDNILMVRDALAESSAGALTLQVFEPGEIVSTFAITEAVRLDKVPAGYTWLGYDQGRTPAAPLFGAVPFGLSPWAYLAWWYEGRENSWPGRSITTRAFTRSFAASSARKQPGGFGSP